ncbi:hypothetical protein [Actinomadura latina]|uniref:hypothetical protein n=1 Tax=Actinomadura latina TaxID=163603 RepID=UPI0012FA2E64|nr:hypothetical protein [Actinomadura latina]
MAIQFGQGEHAFLEATLEIAWPDYPKSLTSEEQLAEDFEIRFRTTLAQVGRRLGGPAFVGTYGDEGLPENINAVIIALWPMSSAVLSLDFKHEDAGLPFRITTTWSPGRL